MQQVVGRDTSSPGLAQHVRLGKEVAESGRGESSPLDVAWRCQREVTGVWVDGDVVGGGGAWGDL